MGVYGEWFMAPPAGGEGVLDTVQLYIVYPTPYTVHSKPYTVALFFLGGPTSLHTSQPKRGTAGTDGGVGAVVSRRN